MKISLLLVEDTRLLREGIAARLNEQPGLRVVAVASDHEAATRQVRLARPQVVLLDACLGHPGSRRLIETLREVSPTTRVIVMAFSPALDDVPELMTLGVAGFIAKDATLEDVVTTIESVAGGTHVLPPSLVESLFAQITTARDAQLDDAVRLTEREHEITRMIGQGFSNKDVAQRLHISPHTVKNHVHSILGKLALHSRLQIAAYAVRQQQHQSGDSFAPSEHANPHK